MSGKYTEFREYKTFYSKISQYKVLSTKPRWEICKKMSEISQTDCRQYIKLEYRYNLKNTILGHYLTSNETPNQVPISIPYP